MKIIYSDDNSHIDDYTNSIFLAGPTPRSCDVKSWRPEAIDILRKIGFCGTVFYPEYSNFEDMKDSIDYNSQVEWEYKHLENCSKIIFWVPRDLKTMPAFTTNVEFGRYCQEERTIYGRPDDAPNNKYLDWLYSKMKHGRPYNNLESLLKSADRDLSKKLWYTKANHLMDHIDKLDKEGYITVDTDDIKRWFLGCCVWKENENNEIIPESKEYHIIRLSVMKYNHSKEEQKEFSEWKRKRKES